MKHDVLQFFRKLPETEVEQFNTAFELYRRSPGKSSAIERTLNAGGYTKMNLENLLYDLQKLHDISDIERLALDEPETVKEENPVQDNATNINQSMQADLALVPGNGQPETPGAKEAFRAAYPFLDNLDCPDALKILATDKITHYKAYQSAHSQLQQIEAGTLEVSDEKKTKIAAAAVFHFEANEQIKAELDHYQEKQEILGKHEIFAKLAMEREVDEMSGDDLVNFVKNTPSYISKNTKSLNKAESETRKAELQQKIDKRNEMLALVNKKLGAGGSK